MKKLYSDNKEDQFICLKDPDVCWNAIVTRDKGFDGVFVVGVRSTKIYCRPSCHSRRPGRERVVFFPVPEAAEAAGFRACLRCRPREAVPQDPVLSAVRRVCGYIREHASENIPTLAELGAEAHLSPFYLQRIFKRVMGITPRQYSEAFRTKHLKLRLRETGTVTEALYDVGFGSASRLYEPAAGRLGMSPATYAHGGKGMNITYTVIDSPLGRLLVAATTRGICAVSLGDSDDALIAALTGEYPAARIHRDDNALKERVGLVLELLSGKRPDKELPVDIQVTAFQWQVYQALLAIPPGDTRTYEEVAKTVGRPKAVRAVGHACAANPVAVVIPCHRVVRKDGHLGGYRWGLDRKKRLLALEEQSADSPAGEGGTAS